MATRVGIELSPAACRIIEIDDGLPWLRRAPDTRVRSFEVLTPAEVDSHSSLRALRKRSVAVVVWGVPNDHRQVVVTNKSYEAMRREALTALAGAGIETRGVLADVAPAAGAADGSSRRPVVVALAASAPSWDALAPLHNAGIRVRSLLTPAAALTALARTRRSLAVRDSIEAYIAIDEIATCIALMRNGALITARELAWGYLADVHRGEPRSRDDIADHIAGELREFVAAIGASTNAVGQVCVCGGLPELRSMTVELTQKLDVEVEPLDSMYGLSLSALDEREDEFRERSAEMRLAWAAAAVWPPPLDLLHSRRRRSTKTTWSRAAIVAGTAAGLGIGWQIQQSGFWRSAVPQTATRSAQNARPTAPAPRQPARATVPAPAAATTSSAPSTLPGSPAPPTPAAATPSAPTTSAPPPTPPTPPPTAVAVARPAEPAATAATQAAATQRTSSPSPAPAVMKPPAPVQPTSAVATSGPPSTPPSSATSNRVAPPVGASRSGSSVPSTVAVAKTPAPRAEARPPAESALPFDAALGTILYSPERKLAIIDGRIVGVGDEVRGARVTEITPTAVLLRDGQGRLRRLALTGSR